MKKIQYKDLNIKEQLENKEATIIANGNRSIIIRMKNGILAKIFSNQVLAAPIYREITEEKILSAGRYHNCENVNIPIDAIYDGNDFLGHTMLDAKGPNLWDYYYSLSEYKRVNLKYVTSLFLKASNIIAKNNKRGLIFPDMNMSNFIVKQDEVLEYIDFESIQTGTIPATCLSSELGWELDYYIPKYHDMRTLLYNDNLDKKSLILLYFRMVLGTDLEGTVSQYKFHGASATEAIETIFSCLQLDDCDFAQKVCNVYNDSCNNDYITSDAIRIAENYIIRVENSFENGQLVPRIKFVRKK